MRTIKLLALAALAVTLSSCKAGRTKTLLPNVSGKAGEIIVVIDKDAWEGNEGAAIREILGGDCPYLAQREPLFNVANVPPGSFTNLFKVHRNILLMNVNPQNVKEGMVCQQDKWAQPQSLVQINAFDSESAIALLKENGPVIQEFFEQAERNRIIANAKRFEETSIRPAVEKMTGGTMVFPSGFRLKKVTDDFLWIADVKQYTNQEVLIYRYPALRTDEDFNLGTIIAKRNEIMKANVPGMFENTYMTTSAAITPTAVSKKYRGIPFMETRGFWEVYNDYMGGPFVSHSFYSKDGNDIIVIEAFVYAPKFDKRQLLREVESLLFSFEWKKD